MWGTPTLSQPNAMIVTLSLLLNMHIANESILQLHIHSTDSRAAIPGASHTLPTPFLHTTRIELIRLARRLAASYSGGFLVPPEPLGLITCQMDPDGWALSLPHLHTTCWPGAFGTAPRLRRAHSTRRKAASGWSRRAGASPFASLRGRFGLWLHRSALKGWSKQLRPASCLAGIHGQPINCSGACCQSQTRLACLSLRAALHPCLTATL